MSFIWPWMLLSLLLLPLFVFTYVRMLRERGARIAKIGEIGMAGGEPGKLSRTRHIPPLIILTALAALCFALARPQTVIGLPRVQGTVLLAFDISGSMAADDIQPTRMDAAKSAARLFIEQQPASIEVGIVAFSDGGFAVQAPTNDKLALLAAIERLSPARGTSLGNGMLAAMTVLESAQRQNEGFYNNLDLTPVPTPEPTPVPRGFVQPAVMVLLTDGENNSQPDPLAVAQLAAERGLRIHTVGLGSPNGATVNLDGFNVRTTLNEPLLQGIAELSAGRYYRAESAEALQQIYGDVGSLLTFRQEETELTAIVAGLAGVLLLIGGFLSLVWLNRLP
jgi:Ca-activated chloride channel homolog